MGMRHSGEDTCAPMCRTARLVLLLPTGRKDILHLWQKPVLAVQSAAATQAAKHTNVIPVLDRTVVCQVRVDFILLAISPTWNGMQASTTCFPIRQAIHWHCNAEAGITIRSRCLPPTGGKTNEHLQVDGTEMRAACDSTVTVGFPPVGGILCLMQLVPPVGGKLWCGMLALHGEQMST